MDSGLLRCSAPVMAGSSEKIPIASAGPEDLQQFMPPVSVAGIIRGPCASVGAPTSYRLYLFHDLSKVA